jgi:hypothetical protein
MEPPGDDETDAARRFFAGSCDFLKGVVALDGLPAAAAEGAGAG